MKPSPWPLACLCAFVLAFPMAAAEPSETVGLWPIGPPGENDAVGEESDVTGPKDNVVGGRPVIRLGNVSVPTIAIYRPAPDKNTGTAVVVCPGGAYRILAMDLEGTEVCAWLNSIGVTGILLKYRVPSHPGKAEHPGPLQDAQRAIGLVRHRAREWGIDPARIGVLGFSAGGHLAAAVSNTYQERTYPQLEAVDAVSCRPDFTILIYPAYLTVDKQSDQLAPQLKVTENTPATFLSITADDPVGVEGSLYYALALKRAKVPVELHVYNRGGHGYGLRQQPDLPVTTWPERLADWMKSRSLLTRKQG